MADLLQKVFQIHLRGYFLNGSNNKVYYKGDVYGDSFTGQTTSKVKLLTPQIGGTAYSTLADMNSENTFSNDPWFLYKTYTSYNKMRDDLKSLIASYGTDNVRVSIYVPIDYEVLPNQ